MRPARFRSWRSIWRATPFRLASPAASRSRVGNITGCWLDQPGLTGKWLELIGEAAPGTRHIAVLRDPTTGPWQLAAIRASAEKLRIELQVVEIRRAGDLDHRLGGAVKGGARALVQLSSPLFDSPLAKRIADVT